MTAMTTDIENVPLTGLEEYETSSPSASPKKKAAKKAVAKEPARDEMERLDPQPIEAVVARTSEDDAGIEIDIEPLRLRQFLRLLRIVTRGAAGVLDTSTLSLADEETFVQELIALVLFSVPEAEEETIDFVRSMVKLRNVPSSDVEAKEALMALDAEMENPRLEDMVTIIQLVIEREGSDLRALGKRLSSMFKVAEKMGATKK